MTDPEARCLERFQSLLEIQIEKARARATEKGVEEEDAEVNGYPEGSRERIANKESVLLPPYGSSRLRLKTPTRMPCLWKEGGGGRGGEALGGCAEPGHSKQGNGHTRKVLKFPEKVEENSYRSRNEDTFHLPSPVSSSESGVSPSSSSPLKRKAPISQPASEGDHNTLSPQKIFIIPAPEQRDHEEQQSTVTSCHGKALSTQVLDPHGGASSQSPGYDPKEDGEIKRSSGREMRKKNAREALRLAASWNRGEPLAGRQPQAPEFWSTESNEAVRPARNTRDMTSFPLSKDDVQQRGITKPDCTGAQKLSKASFISLISASKPLDFQEENTSSIREDCTMAEKGADDNNNTCHKQPQRNQKGNTERGKLKGSNASRKAKEINQNGNNEDVTPHDTDVADDASSGERSPVIPDEDCDYDCDFICRLLSPARSARGRRQVSLFQEIQQAEHGERQDTRTEYERTMGRLPHPPLRMLPPHSAITADDGKDCLRSESQSTLLSQESGSSQYTGNETMRELASYTGLDLHNNRMIPRPAACSQSLQDLSPLPAICQNDNHQQDEDLTSMQSVRQSGVVMPFSSSHDILQFENADTEDCLARKQRNESRTTEETIISTDSALVKSNSPPPVIDDYVHTKASLSGTIFTTSSAHTTRLAGILQLSLNKSYFLLSMKNAASMESLLEDNSGSMADDLVIPSVSNTTNSTDVTTDSLPTSQYLPKGKCRKDVSCESSDLGLIKEEKTHILNSLSTAYVCKSTVSENQDFKDRRVGYQRSGCQQSETQLAHSLLTLNNNSLPSHRKRRDSESSRSELTEDANQGDDGYLLEYSFTHRPRPSPNYCQINPKKSRKAMEHSEDVSYSGHLSRSTELKEAEASSSSLPLFGNNKKLPNAPSKTHPDDCKCLDYDCLRKRGEMLHNHVMKNLDVLKLFAGHPPDKRPNFRVQIKEAVGNKAREMIRKQKALLAESPKDVYSTNQFPQEQKPAAKHKSPHASSAPSRRKKEHVWDRDSSGQIEVDAKPSAIKESKYVPETQFRTKPLRQCPGLPPSSRCLPEGQHMAAGFTCALENSLRSSKSPTALSESLNSMARASKRDASTCRRKKRFHHPKTISEKFPPLSRQLVREVLDPLYALKQSDESCERLIHQLNDDQQLTPPRVLEGKRGGGHVTKNKHAHQSARGTDAKYRLPSSAIISTSNEQNPSAYFFSVEVPRLQSSDHRHFLFPSEKCTELCCETKQTIMKSGQKTVTKECEKSLFNPSTQDSSTFYYSMSQELDDGQRTNRPDGSLSTSEKVKSLRSDDMKQSRTCASTETHLEPDNRKEMADSTTADKQGASTVNDSKHSIGINQDNNATIVKSPDTVKPCGVEGNSTYYSQKEVKEFGSNEIENVAQSPKNKTPPNTSYTVTSKYVYQHSVSKSSSSFTHSTIESDQSIIRVIGEEDRESPPTPVMDKSIKHKPRKEKKKKKHHDTTDQTEHSPPDSPDTSTVVQDTCQEEKKQSPAGQTETAPPPPDSPHTRRTSHEAVEQSCAEPKEVPPSQSPATDQHSHAKPSPDETPKEPPVTTDTNDEKADPEPNQKLENPECKAHTHSSSSSYFKNTISMCSSSCTFATPGVKALEIPCLSKPPRPIRPNKFTSRYKAGKTDSESNASSPRWANKSDKADEDLSGSFDQNAKASKTERRRGRRKHTSAVDEDKPEPSADAKGGAGFDFNPAQYLPQQFSLPGSGALDALASFSQWFGSRGTAVRQSASMPVGDLSKKAYQDLASRGGSTSPDRQGAGGNGSHMDFQAVAARLGLSALLARAQALRSLGLGILTGILAVLAVAFHALLSKLPRPAGGLAMPGGTQDGAGSTEAAIRGVTSTSAEDVDGKSSEGNEATTSGAAEALAKRLALIRQFPETVQTYGSVMVKVMLTVILGFMMVGGFLWGSTALVGDASVRAMIDLERLWEELVTRLRLRHLTVPPV